MYMNVWYEWMSIRIARIWKSYECLWMNAYECLWIFYECLWMSTECLNVYECSTGFIVSRMSMNVIWTFMAYEFYKCLWIHLWMSMNVYEMCMNVYEYLYEFYEIFMTMSMNFYECFESLVNVYEFLSMNSSMNVYEYLWIDIWINLLWMPMNGCLFINVPYDSMSMTCLRMSTIWMSRK